MCRWQGFGCAPAPCFHPGRFSCGFGPPRGVLCLSVIIDSCGFLFFSLLCLSELGSRGSSSFTVFELPLRPHLGLAWDAGWNFNSDAASLQSGGCSSLLLVYRVSRLLGY